MANCVQINYSRSIFVRRSTEARANRPFRDMLHWIMYEELRFVLDGTQTQPLLPAKLNEFLGKKTCTLLIQEIDRIANI